MKKLFFLFLLLKTITANAVIKEGTCGVSANWTLDSELGVLTITGYGELNKSDDWGRYQTDIKEIYISDRITHIGDNAFMGMYNVTSIDLPKELQSIGQYAFHGMTGLSYLSIPEKVRSIGNFAFSYCTNLAHIVVDPSNEYFDSRNSSDAIINSQTNTLLFGCKNTVIPDGVTNIGDYAFVHCDKLQEMVIPEGVTTLGHGVFSECEGLTEISLPSTLSNVGSSLFMGCVDLTSITIPTSLTYLGFQMFNGCTSLTTINLPESLSRIGNGAFSDCSSLQSIQIPNNVTVIENSAFSGCYGLKSIQLPEGITKINPWTFYGSGLTSLTLPSTISEIGDLGLSCSALTKLYIKNTTPAKLGSDRLSTLSGGGCVLYVPKDSKNSYLAANGWKNFTTIKENHFDMTTDTQIDITISSAKWSTMILPYDAVIPTSMTVYACDASDEDVLTLEEQSEIKANIPYLVYGEPGTYNFNAVGSAWEDTYTDGWLTGAYIETDVPEDSYILAKVNDIVGFYKVTGTNVGKAKIAPYHCYLTSETPTGQAKAQFLLPDDTTGISAITNADSSKAVITDLAGRRVSSPAKGINIINGVKVMIK